MNFISSAPKRSAIATMIVCDARFTLNINNQTINNMQYYEVKMQKKSHSDFPNKWTTEVIAVKDAVEYNKGVKKLLKGCEDWRIRELTEQEYINYYGRD